MILVGFPQFEHADLQNEQGLDDTLLLVRQPKVKISDGGSYLIRQAPELASTGRFDFVSYDSDSYFGIDLPTIVQLHRRLDCSANKSDVAHNTRIVNFGVWCCATSLWQMLSSSVVLSWYSFHASVISLMT
jgi:hypothetical protein